MKTIYLVRHGKAGDMDAQMTDFERILIERGENDSLKVAVQLKKDKIKPSLIISSPAPRALKTAQIFANKLGYSIKSIRTRKAIYEQADNGLPNIVHQVDDKHDSLMLVGHNPSMADFAQFLIRDFNDDLPTCGVVGIKLKAGTWKEISQGQGVLRLFYHPRNLKETKMFKQKDLEKKLTEQILYVLNEFDEAAGKKIGKSVKESSKTIVKKFIKKIKKKYVRK